MVQGQGFRSSFFSAIFLIFCSKLGLFFIRCQSALLIPIKKPQDEHFIQASYWSGNSARRVGFPHWGADKYLLADRGGYILVHVVGFTLFIPGYRLVVARFRISGFAVYSHVTVMDGLVAHDFGIFGHLCVQLRFRPWFLSYGCRIVLTTATMECGSISLYPVIIKNCIEAGVTGMPAINL